MFESIQAGRFKLAKRPKGRCAMHPVNYLFQDIYRNDWSVAPASSRSRRRNHAGPWIRDLRFLVERKRS
ncbi:MAG: hypothetical protein E5Y02_04265 [Mesorhizobium sp.]|nr:MAG: hypothetical protein E5Y02_04265 [Mesorhizobium sp.]